MYYSHIKLKPTKKNTEFGLVAGVYATLWSTENGIGLLIDFFAGLDFDVVEVISSLAVNAPRANKESRLHYEKAKKSGFSIEEFRPYAAEDDETLH